MNYKDYGKPYKIFYEAFIDIAFLPNDSIEYSDIISIWIGDFHSIMNLLPLNSEEMYVALACHFQVDVPWEDKEDEYWEVDEITESLIQLQYVKNILLKRREKIDSNEEDIKLYEICTDICELFEKANKGEGKVFIKYYY